MTSAQYVFADGDVTQLVFNGDLTVPFPTPTAVTPYVGAGINTSRRTFEVGDQIRSNTRAGRNLLGGLRFGLGTMTAFAWAQYSTTAGGYITTSFGLLRGR
ncbi:MAG TPA: hypothetical protein VNZ57_06630 [Longimicrobiales bacterium]|nr:hypothetical protein [Longimicrobiales bacterium]